MSRIKTKRDWSGAKSIALSYERGKMMKKIRLFAMLSLVFILTTGCGTSDLVVTDGVEDQVKKMDEDLENLKEIKVKYVEAKRIEEMKDTVFKNYFIDPDDKKHQVESVLDGMHSITYETEENTQVLEWDCDRKFLDFYNVYPEDKHIFKETDEKVIQSEMEKLFGCLGLPLNDQENGYVIDKKFVQVDNSVDVHVKRYIKGNGVSIVESSDDSLPRIEEIRVTFGDGQVIGIFLYGLVDEVEVTDMKDDVLVNTSDKVFKVFSNYMEKYDGAQEIPIESCCVSYRAYEGGDEVISLKPVVDIFLKSKDYGYVGQVNPMTKEAEKSQWNSITVE